MVDKVAEALAVTLPVFALVALGWWLRRRGLIDTRQRRFLADLVYWSSLPALIILGIAGRRFSELLAPPVLAALLGGTAVTLVVMLVLVWLCRLPPALRLPAVAVSFWANISYLGFPVADQGWPDGSGRAVAGIVNAFGIALFVLLGTVLLVMGRGEAEPSAPRESLGRRLVPAVANPIVIAALVGLAVAALAELESVRTAPQRFLLVGLTVQAVVNLLSLLGGMGLGLALICVGAALEVDKLRGDAWPITVAVAGKLLLAPLAAFLILAGIFPAVGGAERGVPVVLMGMPTAVGCYVIASRLRRAEGFIGAVLVASTLVSVLTTLLWLSVVL